MIITFTRFIKKAVQIDMVPVLLAIIEKDDIVPGDYQEKNVYYAMAEKEENEGKKCTSPINSLRTRGTSRGVPLSPDESKTWFGRRGRANVATMSSRTCFRMSLTDLADSISFVVSCTTGIFGNYKLSYIEESR